MMSERFLSTAEVADQLESEDLARARWYSFFSRWLLAPPDQQAVQMFTAPSGSAGCSGVGAVPPADSPASDSPCSALPRFAPSRARSSPTDTPGQSSQAVEAPGLRLEAAWVAFADAVAATSLESMRADYDDIFITVGEAPVSLHASVYLTGFANERPLAEIRQWLAGQGIASSQSGLLTEDHLGLLCEVMAWLIIERTGQEAGNDDAAQQFLFKRFLAPVCDEFSQRLAAVPQGGVYRALGELFAAFAGIEKQAFEIDR
ncbi:MAG: molecular chaperone TorD family protein [Lautropia sp.]